MKALPDKAIVDLFKNLAPAGMEAQLRRDRESALLRLHEQVALRVADATFLRLTSEPDFVAGTVTGHVLGKRLEAVLDELIAQGAKVCRSHGFDDAVTRLQGEARIVKAFYQRVYALTLSYQRGHA